MRVVQAERATTREILACGTVLKQGDAPNLRVFPALVVDFVLVTRFLVVRVDLSRVEHFGLVQEFVMEA